MAGAKRPETVTAEISPPSVRAASAHAVRAAARPFAFHNNSKE